MSSSHDTYSQNTESKTTLRASVYDASVDADMSQVFSSDQVVEAELLMKNSNQYRSVSQSHISSLLGDRVLLGTCEQHNGLECHGENIVCTVGASDMSIADGNLIVDLEKKDLVCSTRSNDNIVKLNNVALSAEADDGTQDHETEESNCISRRSVKNVDEPLLNNKYNSVTPLCENHTSPKACSLSSHSSRGSLSLVKGDSKDIEGPLNFLTQADVFRFAEVENVESSLVSLAAGSSQLKSNDLLDSSRGSETRHGLSSVNVHIDDSNQEIRISTGSEILSDNDSRGGDANDPLERDDTLFDSNKVQDPDVQLQAAADSENSELDVVLDDVKVCDICGDAGREDLLSICNRCIDGAEHTYCMREMLQKVPEDDWLCEECKIKEIDNKNLEQCAGSLEPTCSNDVNKKSMITSGPKKLKKLDAKTSNLDAGGSGKGLLCPDVLDRRQGDALDDGKASELNGGSLDTDSPRKKPLLSRQVSLKNQDIGKLKMPDMMVSFEGLPVKGRQPLHRSKTSISSSSLKGQFQLHSPHWNFSRSMSFNNSDTKPKVKRLIENVPYIQNISKASTKNDIRKVGMVKSSSKSLSFESISSGWLNNEPSIKAQSLPHNHDPIGLKELKERNDAEKNFSATHNSFFQPSASVSKNCSTTKDGKYAQNGEKLNCILEPTVLLNKEPNDANDIGCKEGTKHLSYSSRSIGFSSGKNSADNPRQSKVPKESSLMSIAVDRSACKVETASQHDVGQPSDLSQKDVKMSDSSMLVSSRTSTSGGNKILLCQRCNEIGHATQNCSIEKARISAHNPLAYRSSRQLMKKGHKWQDAVDEIILRSRALKGGKPDTFEELPVVITDTICKMPSQTTPNPLNQRRFSSVIECSNDEGGKELDGDPEKAKAVADFELPSVHPVEFSDVLKSNRSSDISTINGLDVKPSAENLLAVVPLFAKPSRASAIPMLECIWRGNLNILASGNPPEIFYGIQAHLSSCASDRAFEVANKAQSSIQLEEVTHKSSWPLQFQQIGPQDENIALFFFAKDIESYQKSYTKLMDKMHRNDLALRGNIDGTELLIFTSNKLPENSQRWNRMYYLWGIFRAKSRYNLPTIDHNKKPWLSNLDTEVKSQELSVLPMNDVPNAQSSESGAGSKKSSECNTSAKIDPEQSFPAVDLGLIASDIEDKANRAPEASLVHNFMNQLVSDPKMPNEHPSFAVSNSSRTMPDPLSVADTPESRLQISASKLCSEGKNDGSCQKKIISDCTDRKTGDSSALPDDNIMQSSHRKASSVTSVSANHNHDGECSRIGEKLGESTSVAISDDDPRQDTLSADHIIIDWRKNRKRGRSCSAEGITQPSSEMMSNPVETIICRDSSSSMPGEDEREQKKTCFPIGFSITDGSVSSQSCQKQRESTTTEERYFFPIGQDPIPSNRSANLIISPLDDDDNPESCNPDLELALGGKSKSAKPAALPFLFQSADRGKQHLDPGASGEDDGDDVSSSLSLSLSFPALERERSSKRIAKSEQIFPERTPADKSLFLFGRFRDC